jgi:hypothetical protein
MGWEGRDHPEGLKDSPLELTAVTRPPKALGLSGAMAYGIDNDNMFKLALPTSILMGGVSWTKNRKKLSASFCANYPSFASTSRTYDEFPRT